MVAVAPVCVLAEARQDEGIASTSCLIVEIRTDGGGKTKATRSPDADAHRLLRRIQRQLIIATARAMIICVDGLAGTKLATPTAKAMIICAGALAGMTAITKMISACTSLSLIRWIPLGAVGKGWRLG